MTIAMPIPAEPDEAAPPFARRLITVEEFRRMGEAEILLPDERVELIEGEIYKMTPIGKRHMWLVMRLAEALREAAPPPLLLLDQGALELDPHSQLQPDMMLLRRRPESLEAPLPGAPDILLAVEVADTSLRYDRKVKLPVYAKRGVPELWIVDANAKTVEAHRRPSEAGYRESIRFEASRRIAVEAAPQIEIDLSKIFA